MRKLGKAEASTALPCPIAGGGDAGAGVLVVDDWFPNLLTGFRVAEFVHYLRVFPGLRAASTCPIESGHYGRFGERYPDVASRVLPFNISLFEQTSLAWFVFLNNAYVWIDYMDNLEIPFAFTLYPGGGFNLNDAESETKLIRILASPMLRAVIATQPITLSILERFKCRVPVNYIPGVVVNPAYIEASRSRSSGLAALRICFAAFRYDEGGRSKGYPEFIQSSAILAERYPDLVFSVAGDLGPDDWPIPLPLVGRISFKGPLATLELKQFFAEQNILVSPSRRYAMSNRGFDGFPAGTCVEASLCGVLVLSSDELDQNRHYRAGEEILICAPEVQKIVDSLEPVILNKSRLAQIAEAGRRRTVDLYSASVQLLPRTKLLRLLAADAGLVV
jgi:lipopolysaccharide transport system ATP-binding protein